nr:hypothetical protein [Tanacetum cinerariifolium]
MRRCTFHHRFSIDFLLKLVVRVLLSLVSRDDPLSIDIHNGKAHKRYAKNMIQQNLWMVKKKDLQTYLHQTLHFEHYQQQFQVRMELDYLVAVHVVVVVARQHPVKCLEYLETVEMNLLATLQSPLLL